MRRFEIIDRDAFIRDIPNGNYDDVILPKRDTISSAGYDFYSVISVTLKPGEIFFSESKRTLSFTTILPESGVWIPAIQRRVILFPLPDAPRIPIGEPSLSSFTFRVKP